MRSGIVAVVPGDRSVWSLGAPRIIGLLAGAAVLLVACGGKSQQAYTPPKIGPAIYKASCATCHGLNGLGFVGPSLATSVAKYPDVADEIAVVTHGRGLMPGWGGRFTKKQIAAVVDYTRTKFARRSSGTSTTTGPDTAGLPTSSRP